ncbi:unnamed protein product [Phyllotreta striolata]|uniref:Uncharacterized protein n=1 Tax=Phyllotreta striolata TaxID=444603 RepID=A0A9P0GMP9_PHYSR|nr:unnamed protein product [Phyllotreta striolata]
MEERSNILKQMKVCRFCLTDDENCLTNIHDKLTKGSDVSVPLPSLTLQIMACTAIEVIKNDNMPQFICNTCRNLTSQAYIFKANCKKVDDALKLFLVTGQLTKPNMQNVVQIKVKPAEYKVIKIVQEEDEEIGKVADNQITDETPMEFEDIETNDSEIATNKTTVTQVKTECYPCTEPSCNRTFALKQLLDIHMKNHSRERKFECDECESKFFTKYELQKHVLTHNASKEYQCVVCDKSFLRESMLRRHEKTHIDAPKYVCLECDKTFLTKDYLELHLQKHKKEKPFTCQICSKSFVFKQGLERHQQVHSENKPFKCNYCEESFNSAIKLTRHITTHAGLRPYPCKLCKRTFLLSHHLTRHMRNHYTAKTSWDHLGQHKCDICSMSFKKKESLVNHSAIHSMVNLKCVICNMKFESADLVKEHITTHLSGLPHPCDKCDYSFETAEQLEEHELKHAEMEYEEQIEKEVLSESIQQMGAEGQNSEEDEEFLEEEGEVGEYTIEDINNPNSRIRSIQEPDNDIKTEIHDLEFLRPDFDNELEQTVESSTQAVEEIEEQDEEEEAQEESIKPIIRVEGTKMYERKNAPTKIHSAPTRFGSIDNPADQLQSTLASINNDATSSVSRKVGDRVVKVKKFILTKDEMKAMAKQGIIEVKNGQVVLKSGGQQILNATLKPIQKNEIDSLLDKRQSAGNKLQVKTYKKNLPQQDS